MTTYDLEVYSAYNDNPVIIEVSLSSRYKTHDQLFDAIESVLRRVTKRHLVVAWRLYLHNTRHNVIGYQVN